MKSWRCSYLKTKQILFGIIMLTFIIQIIPIGLPVVGYHNWKSTHYLLQIRDFAENQNIPPHIYMDRSNNYSGVAADTFPVYQIVAGSLFMVFGDHVEIARLVDIVFHLLSVVVLFYLVFEISKNRNLSLLSSAVFALFPLSIYFSQNIMVLSTSMFFSLLGCLAYHRYRDNHKKTWLVIFPVALVIGVLSFYSFFIIPLVFVFPYFLRDMRCFERFICDIRECVCLIFSVSCAVIIGMSWLIYIDTLPRTHEMMVDVSAVVSSRFMSVSPVYFMENLSILGIAFIMLGLLYIARFYSKNRVFIIGVTCVVGWVVVMSHKLSLHSYHWYPLLPFFAVLCALGVVYLFNQHFKIHYKNLIFIGLFVSFCVFYVPLFTTTYPGNQTAGDYINGNGGGNVFHSAYQSYSVMVYSGGDGVEIPFDVGEMMYLEDTMGFRWVYLCDWEVDMLSSEVSHHIDTSYSSVLTGDGYELFEYTGNGGGAI